ncbi:hypothetical protein BGZ96_001185 [Linnemannia gamsii]|uniref:Protein kinase domain-containing protein n=1 Tax=Linnemannia gamsii TaxID=64522 RepID=A0ABQ7JN89_9FUNG|nr:hypothetical protein BGZ96_001185 [Linnemannia gamsii]
MATPTQIIITTEVGQSSKIEGKKLPPHSQEQFKEKPASALTPSASKTIDPIALANVMIPDKVKKYPGFIHPYAIYIQECQTFRVESLVSAGGFGSVFKVVNGAKTYAIKAQRAEVSVQRDRMFRSEARFLKRSVHANVVGFFGEFRHGDHLCLRLEWMPKTVFDIIARRASIQEVQQITYSIASGLKSLHDKNFVHRDIKPENILVSGPASRMIVKLADFGLAGYMKGGRKLR